jgi:hypothetical protein
MLNSLLDAGLKVKHLSGVYGADRDFWISRSKMVLNLHYYEAKIFEIVRMFYLLTNSVPVVAEIGAETIVDKWLTKAVSGASYDTLPKRCIEVCESPDVATELAYRGFEAISQGSQQDYTEAALDQ